MKTARWLALLGGAVSVYAMRQADPDLFGYLMYGRFFLQAGLFAPDPFAFTSAGSHWVTFEYVAHILLSLAYDRFGPLGLLALKCVVGGTAIYFLSVAVRAAARDPLTWLPVFLISATTIGRFFVFRPQLFTFAGFALFVAVLFRAMLHGKGPLWVLPAAMLVWANSHGGFVAGLGVLLLGLFVYAARNANGEQPLLDGAGPLLLTLAGCIVATLFNPQGTRLWTYVLTELAHDTNRRYIAEWRPVSWHGDVWTSIALTFTTVAFAGLIAIAQRRRRLVSGLHPWQWGLTCLPLIVMVYGAIRHVPLAMLWMAPVMALIAGSLRDADTETFHHARRRFYAHRIWTVVTVVAFVSVLLTIAAVFERPAPTIATGGNIFGSTHPCRVVNFMRKNRLRGNVYNPLSWGSYLMWQTYPSIRVSMDGRNISLFPDRMVEENLRFYLSPITPADLDVPFEYPTDFLLVPSSAPILPLIRSDARWSRIYDDSDASLFVRADAAHAATVAASAAGVFTEPPERCPPTLQ